MAYVRIGRCHRKKESMKLRAKIWSRPQWLILIGLILLASVGWVFLLGSLSFRPTRVVSEQKLLVAEHNSRQLPENIVGPKSWGHSVRSPKYQFVLCAKVGTESPYLIEWVEFHRLQGVKKFVLYGDDVPVDVRHRVHSNNLLLIKRLYADKMGLPDLIEIHPMTPSFHESYQDILSEAKMPTGTYQLHRLGQQSVLKHCWERHKKDTEWLIHIDVDEFLYCPKHDTLNEFFDSLYTKHPKGPDISVAQAYQRGNISGLYVSPVTFGLTDFRIADNRVAFRAVPARGDIEILYDPRFKRMQGVEEAGESLRMGLDWMRNSQELLKSSKLDWFRELLEHDSRPLDNTLEDTSKEYVVKEGSDPDQVLEHAWELAAQNYPLVIEDQIQRLPSPLLGDSFHDLANAVISKFPICKEYVEALLEPRNANLRSQVKAKQRIKALGEPPSSVCVPGELPSKVTNIGKSLTWTGQRFNPPSEWIPVSPAYASKAEVSLLNASRPVSRPVFNPRLSGPNQSEGCLQPWVHHCSHKTMAPYVRADVNEELRLDHHILRSIESRTSANAVWRNAMATSMFANDDFDPALLEFTALIRDTSKLKMVKRLRQSLAAMEVIPMHTKLEASDGKIHTYWKHTSCSLPLLLNRKQQVCPPEFPLVGLMGTRVNPPHGLHVYSWCTNASFVNAKYSHVSPNYEMNEVFGGRCSNTPNDEYCSPSLRYLVDQLPAQSISLCPGHPFVPCCDYNPRYWEFQRQALITLGAGLSHELSLQRNLSVEYWAKEMVLNNHF